MGLLHKGNSDGWDTSPIIRRLRGFRAYAPVRGMVGLGAGYVVYTELSQDPVFTGVVAGAAFIAAKPLARECVGALAWITRPWRRMVSRQKDGQGGAAGFATLFEEFDCRYRKGDILLGASWYDPALLLGQRDDRGMGTFGTARSGKQRAHTIPAALTWPHSLFVIDAKGQHTAVAHAARERFGASYVVAPFGRVPQGIKTSCWNPLDWLDTQSNTYYEDVCALGDALVMPTDMRNFFFDDSARQIISGCISHIKTRYPDHASLPTVRKMLMAPPDMFEEQLREMGQNREGGTLARDAAARIARARGTNELNAVMSTVDYNMHWCSSAAFQHTLSRSDFSFEEFQDDPASLFLVLPVEELDKHGRFLRLFVYSAIRQFAKRKAKVPILMILDEFYSLGTMNFMVKAISNIPGFNIRIWPICQNYTQLVEMYPENHPTWTANGASTSWLSVGDDITASQLADHLGRYSRSGQFFNLREKSELARLTSREGGITLITRGGKSPLLVRRLNYDITFKKSEFAPDPDHKLTGWEAFKHKLQRAWWRVNRWI